MTALKKKTNGRRYFDFPVELPDGAEETYRVLAPSIETATAVRETVMAASQIARAQALGTLDERTEIEAPTLERITEAEDGRVVPLHERLVGTEVWERMVADGVDDVTARLIWTTIVVWVLSGEAEAISHWENDGDEAPKAPKAPQDRKKKAPKKR